MNDERSRVRYSVPGQRALYKWPSNMVAQKRLMLNGTKILNKKLKAQKYDV